jgi:hypothetical protein
VATARPSPPSALSPALEAELVATADRLVPSRAGDQIVLVNRMARSSPRFQIFLAPALDGRIAPDVAVIPGAQRFVNARTNDHRMRHSAFRAFKGPQQDGEPFGHGWLLEEQRAGEHFSKLIEFIRSK